MRILTGTHTLARHSTSNTESSAAWSQLSQLGSAITQSSLVQKIRRAASQPALASTQTAGLGDVADVVLRGPSSSTGNPDAMRSLPPVTVRKDAKKD